MGAKLWVTSLVLLLCMVSIDVIAAREHHEAVLRSGALSFEKRPPQSSAKSYYPAMFVFGDSLSDTGNNNKLITFAKANKPPYGRDFIAGAATGRFCNGFISTDYLAILAGLPIMPPYFSAGDNILQGVSFASGGSGILNSSGNVVGQHVALSEQVTYFAEVKAAIERRVGEQRAADLLSRALFYVNIGSNDYLVNYLLTNGRFRTPLQLQYSPSQFADLLLSSLQERIMELHGMGARKFAVVGVSALGCVPMQLRLQGSKNGECIDFINELSQQYNAALLERLQALQASYPDARFTYLSSYNFVASIVEHPSAYGFEYVNTSCCGSGRYHALPTCGLQDASVCADASKHVFWDFVHPTSAVNKIAADKFWSGSFPDVNPLNLKDLALA